MAMTDMKQSQSEMKAMYPTEATMPKEDYPYGLRIRLGESELKKLGMDKLPEVGDEIELDAKVKVVSTNQSASEGSKSKSVELQITHMEMGGGDEEEGEGEYDASRESTRANTIYPNGGK